MVRNLGTIERFARIMAGVALLGLFGALPTPWRYLTLVGLIPFGTGLLGHCPVYRAIGWKGRWAGTGGAAPADPAPTGEALAARHPSSGGVTTPSHRRAQSLKEASP